MIRSYPSETVPFVNAILAQRIKKNNVFPFLDDLLELDLDFYQFGITYKTFENTLVDTHAPWLQQFYHGAALLVVLNIIGYDNKARHGILPLADIG